MLSLVVRFVVLAACLVNVQSWTKNCPHTKPVPNFDPKELIGTWYEIITTDSPKYECSSFTLTPDDDSGHFTYEERYAKKGYLTRTHTASWKPYGNDSATFIMKRYDEIFHVVAMLPDYAIIIVCSSPDNNYKYAYGMGIARASKIRDVAYRTMGELMKKWTGKDEQFQVNQYDCPTERDPTSR